MNSDYERISRAIAFIASHAESRPSLDAIAAHIGLSRYHFQRLFCRWAGVSPKRFLQVLTVERAKRLLAQSRSLLEVSEDIGLTSSSRLYDHFVQLEGVTPGEFKAGGEGLSMAYGMHETPFGMAFIGITPRGIASLEFLDDISVEQPLRRLSGKWPRASFAEDADGTGEVMRELFRRTGRPDRPLSLYVSGTNFQVSVWRALLQIPQGSVTSYGDVASAIGHPGSARAVGSAAGRNPVAFLIPCHRVIRQTGELGGYRWGLERKRAICCWEAARATEQQ